MNKKALIKPNERKVNRYLNSLNCYNINKRLKGDALQ